jgi:hypothetical protein
MERRDFIKATALGMAAAGLGSAAQAQVQTAQGGQVKATGPVTSRIAENPDMKYRPLGITGERVSLIGLGGFHLAKPGGPTADEAIQIVHAGIEAGINFCDNCWDYNGGESEIRLGRALSQGGYRDRVFLMTKIDGRTAKAATQQIDESLSRLKTDHLDLLQFHEIIRGDDPEKVFADGAALEAVLRAREQGKLLHRTQEPGDTQEDVRRRRPAQIPFRHGADAAQCDGRAFPELRAGRSAGGARAPDGGARHEDVRRPVHL